MCNVFYNYICFCKILEKKTISTGYLNDFSPRASVDSFKKILNFVFKGGGVG